MNTPRVEASSGVLDDIECWALLAGASVGRIAYIVGGRPMIVPVNFAVIQEQIVFRSDPGDKMAWIPQQLICIEADGSEEPGSVWSVIARGLARDVTNALNVEYEEMRRTVVPTFAPLHDPHWIAIEVESINGRRLQRR